MPYDPNIHHRRSVRLQEYDYSQDGFYFVTICVHDRLPLFGEIVDGEMRMNDAGRIVEKEYLQLTDKYPHVVCHEYVVMPNHFHCIIQITDDVTESLSPTVGAGSARPDRMTCDVNAGGQTPPLQLASLGQIIAYFKYWTTKILNRPTRLWQRNYYEHIIRDQRSYEEISCYILDNPMHWPDDQLYV